MDPWWSGERYDPSEAATHALVIGVSRYVEVEPEEEKHVFLPGESRTRGREMIGAAALAATSSVFTPDAIPPPEAYAPDDEDDPRHDPAVWYMRVVTGDTGERVDVPPPESRPGVSDYESGRSSIVLSVRADRAAPLLAQVARHGMIPINVALPLAPERSCALHVVLHENVGGISVAAAPEAADDAGLEAFAGYLASGLTTEALEIARGELRFRGALGSVLTGLTLLSAREHPLDKHDAEPVEWLPDWYVLAGERALRLGDESNARSYFEAALQTGIPVLADATGLLVARIRAGFGGNAPSFAVERLLAAADRSELATLTTTFPAADPTDADATQYAPEHFDGWFQYRREKEVTEVPA